jgi:predicted CXXCH cytochrome family protein
VADAVHQTSVSCRACHQPAWEAWRATGHALANRPVSASDAPALGAFHPPAGVGPGSAPNFILGAGPLWQPLLPTSGGRWQPHELAFDPAKQEWFNIFGTEGRRPGEWGHWTGRGMNWNSMCAQCHMTGYRKNYDLATDSYHSSWVEQGIGCIQCHGPTAPAHGAGSRPAASKPPAPFFGSRNRMMQTCATCHSRSEALTGDFQPGDNYDDHYRVTLPIEPHVFYPDGQQQDEDFTWTSVLLSRMGHAGVTCMDCHDPHSGKTILPIAHNQLCLQCHAAPGRVLASGVRAVPIDPEAHSHHAAGSAGDSCVACHMPTTNYMQRSPRHDHGWLRPDPLLTKELAIPNACNRCHVDKSPDWAVDRTTAWYGSKMDSRQRVRARGVAAAQTGDPAAMAALLKLLGGEDIPAWRATYLGLLAPYAGNSAAVISAGRAALTAPDPIERAAGVRLLAGDKSAMEWVRPLLRDSVRLVRLDASWMLANELVAGSPQRKEMDSYLALSADQPAGRLRLGQDLANRGHLAEAEKEIAVAAKWDPFSPGILEAQGEVLEALGRPADAAGEFQRAAELLPADANDAVRSALGYAEAGKPAEAEAQFRLAVNRVPTFDRAWYNLGLLLAQTNRLSEAAVDLKKAESLAPGVADYPYALATVLLRMGDRAGAREAARRTLQLEPGQADAQGLLRILP